MWCAVLACARNSHFSESTAPSIVCENLGYLLVGVRSTTERVWNSSHIVLRYYGQDGLPLVEHLISESLLDLLGDLLKEALASEDELRGVGTRQNSLC